MSWNPLSISNVVMWLSPAHTAHQRQEYGSNGNVQGVTAVADGTVVGQISEPAGGFLVGAPGSTNRPTLNTDGSDAYWTFSSSNHVLYVVNTSQLRFLTYQPSATILVRVRMADATPAATSYILDCANATNGSIGFSLRVNTTGTVDFLLGNGAASVFSSALTTTATLSDNTWHDIIIKLNYAGNSASIQIDNTTPVTRTFADDGTDSAWTFSRIDIGRRNNATGSLAGDIKSIFICSGVADDADITLWKAYDPAITTESLAVATSSAESIAPTDVPFLHRWYDTHDLTTMWTTSAKSTQVANDDDPIGYLANKKPIASGSSWNRDGSQSTTTKRPLYKTNQINSLGAGRWSGDSVSPNTSDWTGENDLVLAGADWPTAAQTIIIVYKQDDATQGSHLLQGYTYIVATGTNYQTSGRGELVIHPTGGIAAHSPVPTDSEGTNITVWRHDGTTGTLYVNGAAGTQATGLGFFTIQHMGRPAHNDSGGDWDMDGNIAEVLVYNAILPLDVVRRLVNTLATTWGQSEAFRGPGGYAAMRRRRA